MDANTLTPRDLFDSKVVYEIPPFQRPYVWTEEDQWQPLWEDIERLAESYLTSRSADEHPDANHHFLGAIPPATGALRIGARKGNRESTVARAPLPSWQCASSP